MLFSSVGDPGREIDADPNSEEPRDTWRSGVCAGDSAPLNSCSWSVDVAMARSTMAAELLAVEVPGIAVSS